MKIPIIMIITILILRGNFILEQHIEMSQILQQIN